MQKKNDTFIIECLEEQIVNELETIFERHESDRVLVMGTTCAGKTTLAKHFECVDTDEILGSIMTDEEIAYVCSDADDVGEVYDKYYNKIIVKHNNPVFGPWYLPCDVAILLYIDDVILKRRCLQRDVNYEAAINFRNMCEDEWRTLKSENHKALYRINVANK